MLARKTLLCNNRIRTPEHVACISLKTGEKFGKSPDRIQSGISLLSARKKNLYRKNRKRRDFSLFFFSYRYIIQWKLGKRSAARSLVRVYAHRDIHTYILELKCIYATAVKREPRGDRVTPSVVATATLNRARRRSYFSRRIFPAPSAERVEGHGQRGREPRVRARVYSDRLSIRKEERETAGDESRAGSAWRRASVYIYEGVRVSPSQLLAVFNGLWLLVSRLKRTD